MAKSKRKTHDMTIATAYCNEVARIEYRNWGGFPPSAIEKAYLAGLDRGRGQINRFVKAAKAAIVAMERGQPPKGGATESAIRRLRAAVGDVEGKGE